MTVTVLSATASNHMPMEGSTPRANRSLRLYIGISQTACYHD